MLRAIYLYFIILTDVYSNKKNKEEEEKKK